MRYFTPCNQFPFFAIPYSGVKLLKEISYHFNQNFRFSKSSGHLTVSLTKWKPGMIRLTNMSYNFSQNFVRGLQTCSDKGHPGSNMMLKIEKWTLYFCKQTYRFIRPARQQFHTNIRLNGFRCTLVYIQIQYIPCFISVVLFLISILQTKGPFRHILHTFQI